MGEKKMLKCPECGGKLNKLKCVKCGQEYDEEDGKLLRMNVPYGYLKKYVYKS